MRSRSSPSISNSPHKLHCGLLPSFSLPPPFSRMPNVHLTSEEFFDQVKKATRSLTITLLSKDALQVNLADNLVDKTLKQSDGFLLVFPLKCLAVSLQPTLMRLLHGTFALDLFLKNLSKMAQTQFSILI